MNRLFERISEAGLLLVLVMHVYGYFASPLPRGLFMSLRLALIPLGLAALRKSLRAPTEWRLPRPWRAFCNVLMGLFGSLTVILFGFVRTTEGALGVSSHSAYLWPLWNVDGDRYRRLEQQWLSFAVLSLYVIIAGTFRFSHSAATRAVAAERRVPHTKQILTAGRLRIAALVVPVGTILVGELLRDSILISNSSAKFIIMVGGGALILSMLIVGFSLIWDIHR